MLHHELVELLSLVIQVKIVKLDNLNELRSILRICSVTTLLQSACPTLVVGARVVEQSSVARLCCKKTAVVLETLTWIVVCSEALSAFVVVMKHTTTGPAVAFYAEMVVR